MAYTQSASATIEQGPVLSPSLPPYTLLWAIAERVVKRGQKKPGVKRFYLVCRTKTPADPDSHRVVASVREKHPDINWIETPYVASSGVPGMAANPWWIAPGEIGPTGPVFLEIPENDPMVGAYAHQVVDRSVAPPSGMKTVPFLKDS